MRHGISGLLEKGGLDSKCKLSVLVCGHCSIAPGIHTGFFKKCGSWGPGRSSVLEHLPNMLRADFNLQREKNKVTS